MKVINFVYSRNKLDFKKYIKNVDYDDVISYHDIITKLIKNDKNNEKPSDNVINTYLIRKITKSVSCDNDSTILYALSDINYNTINSICNLILENCTTDVEFNCIIINHKKINISEDDINCLKSIKFIKNIEISELND
jgi:hypothetical protein